jgi:uncharacterized protein YbbC (DUF1343 family)
MTTVRTGAEVLAASRFQGLDGKRVGLIANSASMVGDAHLAGLLNRAPNLKLAAILAPEHGFRMADEAGAHVEDAIDPITGKPVFSLYGATQKPSPGMLRDVDALAFDLQDVGVRFYTYISTLGLSMQAAAEACVPFVVLDRPNPIGGEYVSGFILEAEERSFAGVYEIPLIHGLTVGELANLIKGQRLLEGLEDLHLIVIPMEGWQRWMRWPDTHLSWRRTSPSIVTFETALVYAGLGLFEATSISYGRGTDTPYTVLGAPWLDADSMAGTLSSLDLPGVSFRPTQFKPQSMPGMASQPVFEGQLIPGIRILVCDFRTYRPLETALHLLKEFNREARRRNERDFISRVEWLNKLSGTKKLAGSIDSDVEVEEIVKMWQRDVELFEGLRSRYLLY